MGLAVTGSTQVVLARLWVHDTAGVGVVLQNDAGPTSVGLSGSLVERVSGAGVFSIGADATVESTVVRGTLLEVDGRDGRGADFQPGFLPKYRPRVAIRGSVIESNHTLGVFLGSVDATVETTVVRDTMRDSYGHAGWGVNAQPSPATAERPNVVFRGILIERNQDVGAYIAGADLVVDRTVLRDTMSSGLQGLGGRGLNIQSDIAVTDRRANATIRASLIDNNGGLGLFIAGSDGLVETTVVRHTQMDVAEWSGWGVDIQQDPVTGELASVTVRASLVETSREVGVYVGNSDATLESTAVRDTLPNEHTGWGGWGIDALADEAPVPVTTTLRNSLVERSCGVGVSVWGSDATVERTVVRETLVNELVGWGRGINVQPGTVHAGPANVAIRDSVVEGSTKVGVFIGGSHATIESTVVRDTSVGTTGSGGDALLVLSLRGLPDDLPASAEIRGSLLQESARVGAAGFGATITLERTTSDCNAIDLNGEEHYIAGTDAVSWPFVFVDHGDNVCGCGPQTWECTVLSAGLEAPAPIEGSPSPD
jgi:hypothetical protein